uniref:Uncharacterized protein n=1 Tax=Ananas comosus var. bracteatus TaxID=296719 RepID=A0A6V7PH70_ANACO|nr:unnamed protein product [Ananas comosus var. bracteatus]
MVDCGGDIIPIYGSNLNDCHVFTIINKYIRHLEKATVFIGKEGLVSEGNAACNWSRCVDELESQLSKHGSLKKLYLYHQHLAAVFRNTMFGPEGHPQHCCAWLGVASSFPECAFAIVPEEVSFLLLLLP